MIMAVEGAEEKVSGAYFALVLFLATVVFVVSTILLVMAFDYYGVPFPL